MKINNNIPALITNRQLLRNENSLSKTMERLSTGLKINHASDDPSGLAISGKMKAQIDGLDRSSRNASDGISVIQTADGALNEVTSMIQRMRELAIQAANGITEQGDKEAIQSEIDSLKSEIDRIATSTEFNTKTLLDGSINTRIYADHISRQQSSQTVASGQYNLTIDTAATKANIASGITIGDSLEISAAEAGTVSINGAVVELKEGMRGQEIYQALREASEVGEATISDYGEPLEIESVAYGADAELAIEFSNDDLANKFGLPKSSAQSGNNAKITIDRTSDFSNQATYSVEGNKVIITDQGGFEISFLAEAGYTGDIKMNVTDVGPMDLQIGANEGQYMTVRIPATDTEHMYIDDVDVTTVNGAKRALDKLSDALDYINKARADLGAYQNRLESSVANLDETSENMTSAMSRISDADMAKEMTEYTKYNVLSQSSTSALSQANELPQLALQLLQ
ncbi:MAG: flagellin [Lachnospiraceae bacterium]|nr:flagellin [Lachnospiraceae bacterium]